MFLHIYIYIPSMINYIILNIYYIHMSVYACCFLQKICKCPFSGVAELPQTWLKCAPRRSGGEMTWQVSSTSSYKGSSWCVWKWIISKSKCPFILTFYPHILSHSFYHVLFYSQWILIIYIYTYHLINIAILGCTNPQVAPKCDLFSTKHATHSGVHASASSWHSRPRISGCLPADCHAESNRGVWRGSCITTKGFSAPNGTPTPRRGVELRTLKLHWCHCRLSDANAKGEQQVSPIPSFLTWTVLLNVYHWFWFLIVHVHTRCSGWIIGKCQWRYTALPRHVENVSRHGAFWSIICI